MRFGIKELFVHLHLGVLNAIYEGWGVAEDRFLIGANLRRFKVHFKKRTSSQSLSAHFPQLYRWRHND